MPIASNKITIHQTKAGKILPVLLLTAYYTVLLIGTYHDRLPLIQRLFVVEKTKKAEAEASAEF